MHHGLKVLIYRTSFYLESGKGRPGGGVDEAGAAVPANQPRLGDLLDGDVGVEGDAPVLGRRRLVSLLLRPQRVRPLDFGYLGIPYMRSKITFIFSLLLCLQGDQSGCVKPPVDINTKVPF